MNAYKIFKWILLSVLVIVWIVVSIRICGNDGELWVKSITCLGVLFTVLWSSLNAVDVSIAQMKLRDMEKIERSLDYARRWESQALVMARDFTRKIKAERSDLSDNDLKQKVDTDDDLKRSVNAMFNFFEDMYISVENDLADGVVLKRLFADIYSGEYGIYKRFECIIEHENMKKHLSLLNDLFVK